MTRLAFPDYLDHLRTESARFRAVLTDCDPAARVPACPEWDAGDLLCLRPAEGGREPATGLIRSDQRFARRLTGY